MSAGDRLVYNEWFGEISVAQQRAYKKHNISQSDHDELCDVYGWEDHAGITKAVIDTCATTPHGMFDFFVMRRLAKEDLERRSRAAVEAQTQEVVSGHVPPAE